MEKSEEVQENDDLIVRQKVSTKMTVATRRQTVYQYSSSKCFKTFKTRSGKWKHESNTGDVKELSISTLRESSKRYHEVQRLVFIELLL